MKNKGLAFLAFILWTACATPVNSPRNPASESKQTGPDGVELSMQCTQKNYYGMYPEGGSCNYYGCYPAGGGCNYYGCWPEGGSCNYYGCTRKGDCDFNGCPKRINAIKCGDANSNENKSKNTVTSASNPETGAIRMKCTQHNSFGAYPQGGGCSTFGCWPSGGGCNAFGCWPQGGACNAFGCSASAQCSAQGCPSKVIQLRCSTPQELYNDQGN